MFHHNEIDNIKQYFKENGYVVITNVINEKEIENTINVKYVLIQHCLRL